jgi:hypothetical protein
VVHLNSLQEKYAEKGLTVLAVSKQDAGSIRTFNEEQQAKYPTVAEKSDSMRSYGRSSYPSAFLLAANGRVLWVGHPGELPDSTIEDALANTKILPPWPEALDGSHKAFQKDKYDEAFSKVEKAIADGALPEEDKAAAEQIRDWFVWYGEISLEGAAKQVEGGRAYEASLAYKDLIAQYKKHELGIRAKTALDELMADPDRKNEVKAGEKLAKILEEIREEKPEKALLKLKPMLGKKYEETAAGKRAAEIAKQLEEAIEKEKQG